MGVLYCLMSMGINFIYGIMKVINWSVGEFFMIGAFIQYFLLTSILGPEYWYVGVVLSAAAVFFLGAVFQVLLIKPMFVGIIERKMEYATIVTIAMAIFLRNLFVLIGGPLVYTPPDYAGPTQVFSLPLSGNRFVALIGTVLLMSLFYVFIKKTWQGKAFQGVAQNRAGIQTAGVNVLRFDMLAFGIGSALAGAAGALLAPVFLVHPMCGLVPTIRGFEIIVIAGLGSIPGIIVAGLALGLAESLGTAFIDPSFVDIYGFALLVAVLAVRPYGLFGKPEREV